jgi:hypothetical protein
MLSPTIIPESYVRGDRTAIELFLTGLKTWEVATRRQMSASNPKRC